MAGGGCNKQKLNKSKNRKPLKPSPFVQGGLLYDWSPVVDSPPPRGKSNNGNNSGNYSNASKNKPAARFAIGNGSGGKSKASSSNSKKVEPQKPKMNAIGYIYPQIDPLLYENGDGSNKLDESDPLVLVNTKESKIVAFVDQTPVKEPEIVKYSYVSVTETSLEVDDSFRRGLGFQEEEEEEEEEEGEDPSVNETSPFIENKESSISDSSSSEEIETDEEEDDIPDEVESLDSSESEDSSNSSDSDSDIDEEIAKDYEKAISGSYKDTNLDSPDGKNDNGIYNVDINDTLKKLRGIAIQDASMEYGKKPSSKKKSQTKSSKFEGGADNWSALDDLMLVKDPRIRSSQKKKHAAKFPQSWPSKAEKSNNSRRFPGEKKKQRQETIALKRRERMIRRGVDLGKINLKLEQMVQIGGDIMSFQLTHSRDCLQVQRLASIYCMRSVSQGSGKRRLITVTSTEHTAMPSSSDKIRLGKLLRVGNEESDFTATETPSGSSKSKKTSKLTTGLSPLDSRLTKSKTSSEQIKKKRIDKDTNTGTYATQPVSFISCGNMEPEPVVATVATDEPKPRDQTAGSSSYGAFEMHTSGFGSRMMAKMGYVDGGGLGKDGKGISEPIQVIQRPKALGLGAEDPETTPVDVRSNRLTGGSSRGKSGNVQLRSFEKHTKGFGSKMMAKMGYVEGTGLGRGSQGMVDPIVASRLPKSRGLGAKGY